MLPDEKQDFIIQILATVEEHANVRPSQMAKIQKDLEPIVEDIYNQGSK